jgi:hypothetical protein
MLELEEQLRRYGDAIGRSLAHGDDLDDAGDHELGLERPSGHRRRRWPFLATAAAAACVVAIAVAAVTVLRSDGGDDADTATVGAPAGAVFDARTGTVLLFTDGVGVTALDLDAGSAVRRFLDGERAGDQPYRINHVDDQLVVGWGEIYAAPLDGGPSTLIDSATIFIPAAEPGEVWTVDYPGGRIGQGRAEIRRVTMDGVVAFSAGTLDTDRYSPLYGVPGGLVVRGPEGLAIWNATTGRLSDPIGPATPVISIASDGTHLAWCDDTCADPRVVDLEHTGPPTAPAGASGQRLALSPDGNHLAVLRPTTDGRAELVVTDVTTGDETRVATTPLRDSASLQWANDGHQLFHATDLYGSKRTTLGRYDLATGAWQSVELDLGDNLTFVPIPHDQATGLLTDQRAQPEACRSVEGVFRRSAAPCTFPVTSRTLDSN